MAYRELELTLQSARDLKNVNLFLRMDVYAVASLSGDPMTRQCTPTDTTGGRNPSWDTTVRYSIPPSAAAAGSGWLHVLLRSQRALGDRDVGEVSVPLAELLAGADGPGPQPPRTASYQVHTVHRGEPRGVLNVSYRLGPVVAPVGTRGDDKPPVMAYPVPEQPFKPQNPTPPPQTYQYHPQHDAYAPPQQPYQYHDAYKPPRHDDYASPAPQPYQNHPPHDPYAPPRQDAYAPPPHYHPPHDAYAPPRHDTYAPPPSQYHLPHDAYTPPRHGDAYAPPTKYHPPQDTYAPPRHETTYTQPPQYPHRPYDTAYAPPPQYHSSPHDDAYAPSPGNGKNNGRHSRPTHVYMGPHTQIFLGGDVLTPWSNNVVPPKVVDGPTRPKPSYTPADQPNTSIVKTPTSTLQSKNTVPAAKADDPKLKPSNTPPTQTNTSGLVKTDHSWSTAPSSTSRSNNTAILAKKEDDTKLKPSYTPTHQPNTSSVKIDDSRPPSTPRSNNTIITKAEDPRLKPSYTPTQPNTTSPVKTWPTSSPSTPQKSNNTIPAKANDPKSKPSYTPTQPNTNPVKTDHSTPPSTPQKSNNTMSIPAKANDPKPKPSYTPTQPNTSQVKTQAQPPWPNSSPKKPDHSTTRPQQDTKVAAAAVAHVQSKIVPPGRTDDHSARAQALKGQENISSAAGKINATQAGEYGSNNSMPGGKAENHPSVGPKPAVLQPEKVPIMPTAATALIKLLSQARSGRQLDNSNTLPC